MSRFAVVSDGNNKHCLVDSKLTPALAIDDPDLMAGLPTAVTAATGEPPRRVESELEPTSDGPPAAGMDALTHAIEAYVSRNSTPITDACALAAVGLISAWLRPAVKDGKDATARGQMAYAQFLAGMAFNRRERGDGSMDRY